jgi:hypothetical protein
VELAIVSAATGFENAALAWEPERDTITLNVLGFASTVNVAVAGGKPLLVDHRAAFLKRVENKQYNVRDLDVSSR